MNTVHIETPAEVAAPSPAGALRADLVGWELHQQSNPHIFPTVESWRWFVRQHRAELTERRAVCYVAGRMFVQADNFNRAIVDIGCRLAAARAA